MKDFDVAVCGLIVVDIIGRPINLTRSPTPGSLKFIDEIQIFTGGIVCNSGIAMAKLGLRVGGISRVGDDGWKEFVLAELTKHRIDCRGVSIGSPRPRVGVRGKAPQTSATMVCVDEKGEHVFFHVLGANAKITAADLFDNLALLRRTKILLIGYYGMLPGLEPGLDKTLATLKQKTRSSQRPNGIEIALDTGGSALKRGQLNHLGRCLQSIDYFIPSHSEARALTGESQPRKILDALQAAIPRGQPKVLGLKLGERGCLLREKSAAFGKPRPFGRGEGTKEHFVPAFRVKKVVDTTGAGDCFIAGFLAAILHGFSPREAGLFGNRVSACSVEKLGATAGVRSFEATRKLIPTLGRD